MLIEYFTMSISPEGKLLSIPLLVKGYTPSLAKLPQFLMRLGPHVNWSDEKLCFHTFLRELARYYVPEQLPPSIGPQEGEISSTAPETAESSQTPLNEQLQVRRKELNRAVEHILFPAFRARLVATKSLMKAGVIEVANLKGLYRVFERC